LNVKSFQHSSKKSGLADFVIWIGNHSTTWDLQKSCCIFIWKCWKCTKILS